MRWRRPPLAGGLAAGAAAVGALAFGANPAGPGAAPAGQGGGTDGPGVRAHGLAAAAAWSDALPSGVRMPVPDGDDHLVVLLDGPPAAAVPPAQRAARSAAILAAQAPVEQRVAALGGTVTARWSIALNGMAVTLPQGRGDAVAALDGVRSAVPVTYLSPAASSISGPAPAGGPPPPAAPAGGHPAHIALIDTAIAPQAPQLGGGMGPTFPIIGGRDLVDGDADPTVGDNAPAWEGHGTQMAGTVLAAPALDGLPAVRTPRLLAYRVVAAENVGGVDVPLARSDRVISAVEAALDPDGDGGTSDAADVLLLGVAGAYAGGGQDPVASALAWASRVGAVPVVPAGNDGPTFSRVGSLGGPAQSADVVTVGGAAEDAQPRSATLSVGVGPASAQLRGLPLLGSDPVAVAGAPVVVLPGPGGVGTGASLEAYQASAAAGRNPLGAIVVVARGGGTLAQKAETAALAGAAALVVWDRGGSGVFPSGAQGPLPVPVVGVGPRQGAALAALVSRDDGARAGLSADGRAAAPAAVASFSSTGPTVDGRIKPDLVAPAVQVEAPWAPAPDGSPRTAAMTGTSIAAAQVAAAALRLRVDAPGVSPAVVKAALVTGAVPLREARTVAQGAGVLGDVRVPPVRVSPAGVTAPASATPRRVRVRLVDVSGRGGTYAVTVVNAGGESAVPARAVTVPPGAAAAAVVTLPAAPAGWTGTVLVRDRAGGAVVARAPAATFPAVRPRGGDIAVPRVGTRGGITQAEVRIGRLATVGDRVYSAPLHSVRVELVPGDGSRPMVLAGVGGRHDWAPGAYRFVVSRRLPTGGEVPAGRYRLRVTARGVAGAPRVAESRAFSLR